MPQVAKPRVLYRERCSSSVRMWMHEKGDTSITSAGEAVHPQPPPLPPHPAHPEKAHLREA